MQGYYDFSSPFMKATIISDPGGQDEHRWPLSVQAVGLDPFTNAPFRLTGGTGAEGKSFELSGLSYLTSIEVSFDFGFVSTINVTLTPTMEDGRKILDSTLIEYGISVLEVELGYSVGGLGYVSTGALHGIMQPTEVSFGADVTISLKGIGDAGYTLAATALTGVGELQPRRDHILELLKKLKVDTNVDEWQLDYDALGLLSVPVVISNAGKSYLHVITQLARECGCWIRLVNAGGDTSRLTLVAMGKVVQNAPVRILALHDFPGGLLGPSVGDGGLFPILNVTVSSGTESGVFLSGAAKALTTSGINATTQQETSTKSAKTDVPSTGSPDTDTGVKGVSNDEANTIAAPPDNDELDAALATKTEAAMTSTNTIGLALEIETLGMPDAIPGLMFQVQGVAERIDGKYICFGVKHSASASGFQTTLTLKQNSILMVQSFEKKIPTKFPNETPPLRMDPILPSDQTSGLGITIRATDETGVG